MPSWWGKSFKDVKKKKSKENCVESPHLLSPTEQKGIIRSVLSRKHRNVASEKRSLSRAVSRSPSPTSHVARCQSFADRMNEKTTLPLPHPASQPSVGQTLSGGSLPMLEKRGKPPLVLPIPTRNHVSAKSIITDNDGDLATASVSSNCSIESNDAADSRLHSPVANSFENSSKVISSNTASLLHKDRVSHMPQKTSRDILKPNSCNLVNQFPSTSPKHGLISPHQCNIPSARPAVLGSAPDSSMSSPSRSPMRMMGSEQVLSPMFLAGKPHSDINALGSGQCSSPGSGQTSGHNSLGGDAIGQLFWQQNRCSPECSPIPSPRMTSPGPGSRIQSGSVTPVHPRAGVTAPESPTGHPDEAKKQSHRLPLPPIRVTSSSMFSSSNSTCNNSPSFPRSPGWTEISTSPISRWKKGKLIGRGTCGHVYVGFNSESGEMCAMKEVTLFSDDAKSKESAKQLGQEISLLSRLRHPNIVQYYGSETIDDKLFIYLEYVSGGSIHKLLQEYGKFGESAIRNYTRQILSGLAYLHAKNTVHRDIKGANILVDPSGRIKLADFGMAKHITGQTCPLSFKGSPYWMAPEVIKNTNGCNLAVDIWSLGCTVLEMATSKPPWSQYEGIAAMFKIGNSKELPPIPNELSDQGKDFIRLCLQREPSNRPTAAELLRHSFVKNAAHLERPIPSSNLLQPAQPAGGSVGRNTKGGRHARNIKSLDIEGLATQKLKAMKSITKSSDNHLKNLSCPISPIGSPLLHSRSPHPINGKMSPSPISSPVATSGSSTPLTCGNGALPLNHRAHFSYVYDGYGKLSRSPNNLYINGSTYHESKYDLFRGAGTQPGSPVLRDLLPSESDFPTIPFGKSGIGDLHEPYNGQSVLADRVSQQLVREHRNFTLPLNLIPDSTNPHINGI